MRQLLQPHVMLHILHTCVGYVDTAARNLEAAPYADTSAELSWRSGPPPLPLPLRAARCFSSS